MAESMSFLSKLLEWEPESCMYTQDKYHVCGKEIRKYEEDFSECLRTGLHKDNLILQEDLRKFVIGEGEYVPLMNILSVKIFNERIIKALEKIEKTARDDTLKGPFLYNSKCINLIERRLLDVFDYPNYFIPELKTEYKDQFFKGKKSRVGITAYPPAHVMMSFIKGRVYNFIFRGVTNVLANPWMMKRQRLLPVFMYRRGRRLYAEKVETFSRKVWYNGIPSFYFHKEIVQSLDEEWKDNNYWFTSEDCDLLSTKYAKDFELAKALYLSTVQAKEVHLDSDEVCYHEREYTVYESEESEDEDDEDWTKPKKFKFPEAPSLKQSVRMLILFNEMKKLGPHFGKILDRLAEDDKVVRLFEGIRKNTIEEDREVWARKKGYKSFHKLYEIWSRRQKKVDKGNYRVKGKNIIGKRIFGMLDTWDSSSQHSGLCDPSFIYVLHHFVDYTQELYDTCDGIDKDIHVRDAIMLTNAFRFMLDLHSICAPKLCMSTRLVVQFLASMEQIDPKDFFFKEKNNPFPFFY